MTRFALALALAALLTAVACTTDVPEGRPVSSGQSVTAAGPVLDGFKRPVDLVATADGLRLFVKDDDDIVLVDADAFTVLSKVAYAGDGASQHGLCLTADGRGALATGAKKMLFEARVDERGALSLARKIELKTADGKDAAPLGVAALPDGSGALVCLSRENALGRVDLATGRITDRIPTDVCPWGVVIDREARFAYVTCFGGARPKSGETTAKSAGTDVVVDERGIAKAGVLSVIDLRTATVLATTSTGRHPSAPALSPKGDRLLVACTGADTVEIFRVGDDGRIVREAAVDMKLDPALPYGSLPDAVVFAPDGGSFYTACSGQNAIACTNFVPDRAEPVVVGFLPTNLRPGGLAVRGADLFIADLRGADRKTSDPKRVGFTSTRTIGTVSKAARPTPATDLTASTATAAANARLPRALAALDVGRTNTAPVPVPTRTGEPSTIEHVIYVIKENRTYDQVFGAFGKGDGEPSLCIYGEDVTPNQHAMARRFVLLDNYYCNGVVSADGHGWATQGMTSNYVEKGFGGWARSYDLGTDALAYAGCDFLWDAVLLRGLSFRNYGEFDFPQIRSPKDTWFDVRASGKDGSFRFAQNIQIDRLRRFSAPEFPGWDMKINDQIRADAFLREFAEAERRETFPNLVIVYLPQDHTSGTKKDAPSPRAHVADNDLALGRIVDAVSRSRFWPKTAIFVNEDDPQDGWDHVDGHRSTCLVVSPWAKRGVVVSKFYNQTSVLRTIGRILGTPPLNAIEAGATTMEDCFTTSPDFSPVPLQPSRIPLDEPNGPLTAALALAMPELHAEADAMNFTLPDRIDDDVMNRVLWHLAKGPGVPYPAEWAGAHGRGLKARGLVFGGVDDDD